MKLIGKILLSPSILFSVIVLSSLSVSAQPTNQTCKNLQIIFARGSGQSIGTDGTEADRFLKQLNLRLTQSEILLNQYELGSEEHGGASYPAVNVTNFFNGNLAGAWISSGHSNDYGNSVKEGIDELKSYLASQYQQCSSSHFILAGYSQGAQVIGQSLQHLPEHIRNQIDFVALFGDPKLHLPEGRGISPPACYNENLSSWRRSIGNCETYMGSLQARNPYLPQDMEAKTGLWCLARDLVCGSTTNIFIRDGHEKYALEDGPIDQAVQEIAQRLKTSMPEAEDINTLPIPDKLPTNGPDVMFILDNSTTMTENYYTNFVNPTVTSLANKTIASGGRVGLGTFDGCNGGHRKNNYVSPQPTADQVLKKLSAIKLLVPRCDLSQDLQYAIEDAKDRALWKPGAERILVVITRTPFSKPVIIAPGMFNTKPYDAKLLVTNTQPDSYIYPVVPEDIVDSFNDLKIDGSETRLIDQTKLDRIVNENTRNPQLVARLTSQDYKASPGDSLSFNASPSLVNDDTITGYEWDFDNDDFVDETSTEPHVWHAYPSEFNGAASVRVVTKNGLSSEATATVLIRDPASIPPVAKAPRLSAKRLSATTARLSWQSSDNLANGWAVYVNGVPLGRTPVERHTVNISDLLRDQENTFSVRPIMENGELGDEATATLSKPFGQTLHDLILALINGSNFSSEEIRNLIESIVRSKNQSAHNDK